MAGSRFAYRLYHRPFRRSLQTSHGTWDRRDGMILRLVDAAGQITFGEIAPLPWFGSETIAQAWDFCQHLPPEITAETIAMIPAHLPACQFGFESAWMGHSQRAESIAPHHLSGLLPAGKSALETWQPLWDQGYRTFKWKIGIGDLLTEIQIFHSLTAALPQSARLRLDANGGLTWQEAIVWLESIAATQVEFLEQPLSVDQFDAMLDLSQRYPTPLALDESVATLAQLQTCYQRGWRGVFVVKPSIAGFPSHLRQFWQQQHLDGVVSSVFETAIGRQASLALGAELQTGTDRAAGFGVTHWFNDDLDTLEFEQLWQRLSSV